MGRVCTPDDAMSAIGLIANEGVYQKEAAKRLDVDYWSLCRMLATPEFKPLADQARIGAAETQEALALAALEAIEDDALPGAVTRQVRLSEHHWKSAKVRDPRSYGDKMQLDGDAITGITIKVIQFSQPAAEPECIDVTPTVDKLE